MPVLSVKLELPDGSHKLLNFDPRDPQTGIERVKCPNCEHNGFTVQQALFKISKILVGTTEDAYYKHNIVVCAMCHQWLPDKV